MPLEIRTRITLRLPAPKTHPQYLLVDKVLSDLGRVCGGVTLSSDIPAIFKKNWNLFTSGACTRVLSRLYDILSAEGR